MKIRTIAIVAALLWMGTAHASPIFFTATDLADENTGDDLWRYDYHVANTSGIEIDTFNIYFDIDDYDFNLVSTPFGNEVDPSDYAAPLGWEGLVLPDDTFLGEDGIFAINLALFDPIGEILVSNAVSGFSVEFIWRGAGAPGEQFFEFFSSNDPFGDPAGTGFTQPLATPVPEPALSFLLGIGVLLVMRKRRFPRH